MKLHMAVVTAMAVSLGGLGWLSRSWEPGESGLAPRDLALLEMFQVLGEPNPFASQERRDPPKPPPHSGWTSPLRSSCRVNDAVESRRLRSLLAALPDQATRVPIHPSNYGDRFRVDAFGNPVNPTPKLVVLHETVYGIQSAINTFMTEHPNDDDQVSYHALISLDGELVELLDPVKRAFGAGNSAFDGRWVITNPRVRGSVNNFALHVSLETPLDGEDDGPHHSGYSPQQYDALAVLLASWMKRFNIPFENITTHRVVDLGGERADPRSFDWKALQVRLENIGMLCRQSV
ncbi:MAG: peptidoglycan recognition family protein [Cyanobacteriota bacterium]|nr:peptidoglycan recognition family protein [Cyanobacteriota bacterium]